MNQVPLDEAGTRTYRGGSLEEVLPQIREELGPDALITRQRDGVVGGIGGFFGKKTVEVEARPAAAPFPPAIPFDPPRLDVYDASEAEVEEARPAPVDDNRLLDELYRQASPFAERLTEAELELEELAPEPEPALAPGPAIREPEPERPGNTLSLSRGPAPAAALRDSLAAAGVPAAIADAVIREAERHALPFDRLEPLAVHVRRALADRIRVRHGWTTERRTIALVGPAGAGRTLTAAKLCHAYAAGGIPVAALSAEPAARAIRLGTLAEQVGAAFEIARDPDALARARRDLRGNRLVVCDLPPVEAGDAASIGHAAALLAALRPNEVHLVVPASMPADSVRVLLLDLRAATRVDRLLVTHADDRPGGGVVGAALASRVPVSYVADGGVPASGVRPADPAELAAMVLP